MTSLDERVRATRDLLAGIFARHERVLLAFSGGKDSIVLAHLCEPWAGRFRLLWSNTGFTFPHVEEAIRAHGERYGLEEVRGDLLAAWRENGLPASVLPVSSMWPDGLHEGPQLQPWPACCARVRIAPLHAFLQAQAGPLAVLHGQRHADRAPGLGMSGWAVPPAVEMAAPLADWSTGDVLAFVEAEGLTLPAHYGEVEDSLDCWVCPSALGEKKGASRAAFMARHYPRLLEAVAPGVRRTRDAVLAALVEPSRALATAPAAPVVLQAEPSAGDCLVAALATALGRSYVDIAAILGVRLDPATGAPLDLRGRGVDLMAVGAPLLAAGIAATILPGAADAAALRALLAGRRAVLMVEDEHEGTLEPHALAWTGTRLLDCRGPVAREMSLGGRPVLAALVLTDTITVPEAA